MALTKRVTNKTIRNTKQLLIIFTGLIVSILLLITVSYSTRTQQLHYDNMQNKNNIANHTKLEVGACDIIEPLPTNDPNKVNALRRKLQLAANHDDDDDCYTNHYLPYFVNYTRSRLREKKKHLILHM